MGGTTNRFLAWLTAHKKLLLIIVPLVLLVMLAAVIWAVAGKPPGVSEPGATAPKPAKVAHLLNGELVSPELANRHPIAVMIENSPAARPQVGLNSADLIYEAVTEGGITRFMAVYSQQFPQKVGPVRSARSYFIDYLSEYDAFYVHAGGSPTAIARLGEYKIKAYPHANDGTYKREPQPGVASEHTLFADISKIYQYSVERKKWPATIDFPAWKFKDPSPTPTATGAVTINFSSGQFQVVWSHDPATNLYARAMGGSSHTDRVTSEPVKARTIIAMTVQRSANPAYKGSGKESEWTMTTIGEGAASIFQDGTRLDGTWKKPSRLERTRFYDTNGTEIVLTRGKIWIEIVPPTGSISVAPPPTAPTTP